MNRVVVCSAALLALTLTASRCSPIASSLPKNGLGVAGVPRPNDVAAQNPSSTAPTLSQIRVPLQTRVSPHTDGDATAPDGIIELTDEQIEQLQAQGQARLPQLVISSVPSEGEARFEVALAADEIQAGALENFETDLRPASDGVWTLSILPGATPESRAAQAQVKESLETVRLRMGAEKKEPTAL